MAPLRFIANLKILKAIHNCFQKQYLKFQVAIYRKFKNFESNSQLVTYWTLTLHSCDLSQI